MSPSNNGVDVQGSPVQGTPVQPTEQVAPVTAPPTGQVEPLRDQATPTNTPADIQPTQEEVDRPKTNMGNLPQWDSVLSMEKFQNMGKGEQTKYREKWLRQIQEQNPHVGEDQITQLRQHVYTTKQSTKATVYAPQHMEQVGAAATGGVVKALEDAPIVPEEGSGPSNFKILNYLGNPFEVLPTRTEKDGATTREVVGETRAERAISTSLAAASDYVIESGRTLGEMFGSGARQVATVLKDGMSRVPEDSMKIIDPYGAIGKRAEEKGGAGWYVLDSYMKAGIVMGAGTSYTIGGLEAAVNEQRDIARYEGRSKKYQDMDPKDRWAEIEKVMYSDDYVGMDENVADLIKDQMLPKGMTVKQMDNVILDAMKAGDLPEVEFYRDGEPAPGFLKYVPEDPKAAPGKDVFEVMGQIATANFKPEGAHEAFWDNVSLDNWDDQKYKDASSLRKLKYGKTYEEKYGFWKGLAANVFLSILADPAIWPTLFWSGPIMVTTKVVTSALGKNLGKALAGRLSMRQSIELLGDVVKKSRQTVKQGGKLTKEEHKIVEHAKMIIKGYRSETEFMGKEGKRLTELLDKTDELIGEIPRQGKGSRGGPGWKARAEGAANKVNDIIDDANANGLGIVKDEILDAMKNIPGEGFVPTAETLGRSIPTLKNAASRAGKSMTEGVSGVAPDIAKEAPDVIPEAARTVGGYDMSHIANTIETGDEALARAASQAGKIADGTAPVGKGLIEEAPKVVGDVAQTTGALKIPTKIPTIGDDGFRVVKESVEASDEAVKATEDAARAAASKTEQEAIQDAAELANKKADDLAKERMRLHDPETRKEITDSLRKYEQAADDVTTPPPAQEALYKNLEETWKRFHPDDVELDELKGVLDERRTTRTGGVVENPSGSDLIGDITGNTKRQLSDADKIKQKNFEAGMRRDRDRIGSDQAFKDWTAKGNKPTRIASKTEGKSSRAGEPFRASDRAELARHGIELWEGGKAGGSVRSGLAYGDQFVDKMKNSADKMGDMIASGSKKSKKMIDKIVKENSGDLTPDEMAQMKKTLSEVDLGNKSPGEVDDIVKRAQKEGMDTVDRGGKKAQGSEIGQKKRAAANEKRRMEKTTFMKKNTDGTYTRTTRVGSKVKTSTYTPSEHSNGEYLGSIFGMAQKYWDDMAARFGGSKAAAGVADEVVGEGGYVVGGLGGELRKNIFSIEAQFKDFPMIGKTIKNMYSFVDAGEEFTLDAIKAIAKMGNTGRYSLTQKGKSFLTAIDLEDIPLLHEDMAKFRALPLTEQRRLKPVIDAVDEFYEHWKKAYKEAGVEVDFKKSFTDGTKDANKKILNRLQELRDGKIKSLSFKQLADMGIHNVDETVNLKVPQQLGKLLKDHHRMNEQVLREIKDFKYINIPYAMWFESGFDKGMAIKAFKLANTQKRQTFRIQDLIDSGAIEKSQVNLFDMMGAYGRRASKDLAMLDIKNAMRKGGQLIDMNDVKMMPKKEQGVMLRALKQAGWKRADPRDFPMFNRGYLHPSMSEWLTKLKMTDLNANWYDRTLSSVKGFQFANPFFLPLYDMQQAMAARGMLGMFNLKAWGQDMAWAAKMMKEKPQEYWDILKYGQQSKPMALPYDEFQSKIAGMRDTTAGQYLWNLIKRHNVKGLYNVSWDSAWNMDKFTRFTTTKFMMRKYGMDLFEAAQTSGLIHSDYADVPVKMRRGANRFMFTPTFKMTMARSYYHQVKSMVNVPLKTVLGRSDEITKQERAMARAGTGLIGMLVGLDMFMTGKGWERDQFARRYYKQVEDEDGRIKENTAVYASPLNMVPKYIYKVSKVMNEGYKDDKLGKLWSEFKWDAQPVYRIATDLYNNKQANGNPIYEPFMDSDPMIAAKSAMYATEQVFQIIKTIGLVEAPKDQQEAWDLYRKDMGNVWSYTTKPNSFQYLREPSSQRNIRKIKQMQRDFKQIVQDQMEDGRYDEDRARKGMEELYRRQKRIVDLIEKTEREDERSWMDRMKGGMQ